MCRASAKVGLESIDRMALLALVDPRRGGKLSLVLVVMTVEAARELHLVNRVLAPGDMTSLAVHLRMLAFQGIFRGGVRLHIKLRRLPSVHVVAGEALALIGTL